MTVSLTTLYTRLGGHFGFQAGNVLNQREHMTTLCMNAMMRPSRYPGESKDNVGVSVSRNISASTTAAAAQLPAMAFKVLMWTEAVKHLHKKILDNYVQWCKFLMMPVNCFLTGTHVRSACHLCLARVTARTCRPRTV